MEVWGGNDQEEKTFAMPGLDVFVWSRPQGNSEMGGGDVHLLSSCASGRITRVLLADVCGHGSVFKELAAELRNLMMRNVNVIKQGPLVRGMHQRLREFADRGGFATVLVSTFFAPTSAFGFCNAGHPPPLLYRIGCAEWFVLKQPPTAGSGTDHSPPGVLDQGEYQQFTTRLNHGDIVLSYSNAFTECRDANGGRLGVDGLLQLVQRIDPARPAAILSTLSRLIESGEASNSIQEDATLLLCRATQRHVGWRNNVLAPLRLLRPVNDNTRLT